MPVFACGIIGICSQRELITDWVIWVIAIFYSLLNGKINEARQDLKKTKSVAYRYETPPTNSLHADEHGQLEELNKSWLCSDNGNSEPESSRTNYLKLTFRGSFHLLILSFALAVSASLCRLFQILASDV